MRRTSNRRRKGQALVESALTLTVIMMMLVGAFDLGQVFFVHQSLVERARFTARYASTNYSDTTAVTNYFLYGAPQAQPGITTGFLNVTSSMVAVTRYDANTNNDRMEVKVHDYPYTFIMPYLAGVYTGKPIVATAPTESRDGW